jgi:hypothetical protein
MPEITVFTRETSENDGDLTRRGYGPDEMCNPTDLPLT